MSRAGTILTGRSLGPGVIAEWRMSTSQADLSELVQRGYRFAYSLTHDCAWADDLVQDAWVSILRAAGPWSREYLFATIRNRFVDECRRRRIVGFESLENLSEPKCPDSLGGSESDGSDWTDNLDVRNGNARVEAAGCESWETSIASAALGRALSGLRVEERTVLFLAAVEGYSARAIADLLGYPRGSVLSLMHRARARVRDYLRPPEGVQS